MENPRQHIKYLTMEDILVIADDHVANFKVIKENQLHYLIDAVGAKFGNTELYPTLFQKAAVYAHHIITGHIFWDGNKRIGMHSALLFLVLNNCLLQANIDDSIIELGLKIADGTITNIDVIADHIQSWVQ
jgi:death-on-curing protein